MVHRHAPLTSDAAMETDPDWSTRERVQAQEDQDRIDSYYQRQRRRNRLHRFNQRMRMWEAWERLHMMREDHDIVNRTATGKKIGVKKMPKAPKRRSPSPAPAPVKYHKTYAAASSSSSCAGPTVESSQKYVELQLHSIGMPPVQPLLSPQQMPHDWIEKKFPLPRTMDMSRTIPKLGPQWWSDDSKPPYGQILINDYRIWRANRK